MKAPFDIFLLQVLTYMLKNKSKFICNLKHKEISRFLENEHRDIFNTYNKIEYIPKGKIPKIIWTLWYQNDSEIPLVPRVCLDRMQHLEGYTVNILNKGNLSNFIDISDLIDKVESKEIAIQHFSDVVRMRLLRKYGGIWLDSTIAVLSEEDIRNLFNSLSFFTIKAVVPPIWRFVAAGKWSSFCWAGTKDNPFFSCIDDCFTSFIRNRGCFFEYLHMDYTIMAAYNKVGFIKEMIDNVPPCSTSTAYLANIINEKYDEAFYSEYINKNPLAKLTYKNGTPIEYDSDGTLTYWGKLMREWNH